MQKLNRNWFTEGLLDFEYKQYLLLGYLQGVKQRFDQSLLFPDFQELIQHVQDLNDFQESVERMRAQFPKNISGIDHSKNQIRFEDAIPADESLNEIEQIVTYARPLIQAHTEDGKRLFDLIDENLFIEEVGLMPLSADAGYLLLRRGGLREVNAYQYHTTIFEHANERFRGIHLQHVANFAYMPGSTFESIKLELLRHNRNLPNPATFSVHTRLVFPEAESILPVTKRKFMRHLASHGWM